MPSKETKYNQSREWENGWEIDDEEGADDDRYETDWEEDSTYSQDDDLDLEDPLYEWKVAILERHNRDCEEWDRYRNSVGHDGEDFERENAARLMAEIEKKKPAVVSVPWRKKWRKV